MTRQQRIDAIAARLRVGSDLHIARVEDALGMAPRRGSPDAGEAWEYPGPHNWPDYQDYMEWRLSRADKRSVIADLEAPFESKPDPIQALQDAGQAWEAWLEQLGHKEGRK